jgi:hypothetical protein
MVRNKKGQKRPAVTSITFAYKYIESLGLIYYNFAICNPIDQFSKKVGRAKASGKLTRGARTIQVEAGQKIPNRGVILEILYNFNYNLYYDRIKTSRKYPIGHIYE